MTFLLRNFDSAASHFFYLFKSQIVPDSPKRGRDLLQNREDQKSTLLGRSLGDADALNR